MQIKLNPTTGRIPCTFYCNRPEALMMVVCANACASCAPSYLLCYYGICVICFLLSFYSRVLFCFCPFLRISLLRWRCMLCSLLYTISYGIFSFTAIVPSMSLFSHLLVKDDSNFFSNYCTIFTSSIFQCNDIAALW